jgi:hypothetical protein
MWTGYCCKETLYEVVLMLKGYSLSYLRWKGMLFRSDETLSASNSRMVH